MRDTVIKPTVATGDGVGSSLPHLLRQEWSLEL